ncbi:unnamed protein product [Leptosia nina]|uniref:Uncharacterized protein n=1 Tax=Leptosia nina TaxID=320188 RepID=A0AAV1J107_9NEOP
MAHAHLAVICISMLVMTVISNPALAPSRKMEAKERKNTQERPIIVRRVPSAYFYPFSLWPLPKYPVTEGEEYDRYHTRSIKYVQVQQNKR